MSEIIDSDLKYIKSKIDIARLHSKKILLIGSNGFLGKWFCDVFKSIDASFLCIDVQKDSMISNVDYLSYNIINPLNLLDRYDFIINCAGIASPEKYTKYPVETLDVSYIGTKNILDYANRVNSESVLLFSSSEVYGTPDSKFIPTKESYIGRLPTMSNRSCYDIGKQVLETLVHVYYEKYGTPVKVVRPFNMYGPHMGLDDCRVMSNWIKNIMSGDSIVVYGDGMQTRTFCYAADGIAMMLGALLYGEDGELYNVGNPTPELTMLELADQLYSALDLEKNYKIEEHPNYYPSDEPLRRCPNIDKIVKLTNINPEIGLRAGIRKMYDYYKGDTI